MRIFKRGLSLFLTFVLLFAMVPVVTQAAEGARAEVKNDQVTVEGTNSVGSLISDEIQQYQEEANEDTGYNVIGLTVENNIATVEYGTLEPAVLMVAIYTEDGKQLLLSGKTEVQPQAREARILLEGTIPEYFTATAYLLDQYEYTPLCKPYESILYTQEIQTLRKSTMEDYKDKNVLNLDNSTETNFAVYADSVIVLQQQEGVNILRSADDENKHYVIENPDENIKGLKTGDVFSLAYGAYEVLIVKVATITVSGNVATITGQDTDMHEVFDHVKIEAGDRSDKRPSRDEIFNEEFSLTESLSYKFAELPVKEVKPDGSTVGSISAELKLTGTIGLKVNAGLKIYASWTRQYVELRVNYGLSVDLSIEGKVTFKVPLPEFKLTFYGISIGFEPEIVLEIEGKISFGVEANGTFGFDLDSNTGYTSRNVAPHVDPKFEIEARIFLGIDFVPAVGIAGGAVVDSELHIPVGFELKAVRSQKIELGGYPSSIHQCTDCIALELFFKIEISAELKFFNSEKLTYKKEFGFISKKIDDFYWSITYKEFGTGSCPHFSYLVNTHVTDVDGLNVEGADIVVIDLNTNKQYSFGNTDSYGTASGYLVAGRYTFISHKMKYAKTLSISGSQKVVLDAICETENPGPGANPVQANLKPTQKNYCGPSVEWSINKSGQLTISGHGAMDDYEYVTRVPWYSRMEEITSVKFISSTGVNGRILGVTYIGKNAFNGCTNLTSVTLPLSLTTIGTQAFSGCTSLTSIEFKGNLKYIKEHAFDASGLTNLVVPEGVLEIGYDAFAGCKELTTVTLPDSLTYLGAHAFQECSKLLHITIPDGVTAILEYTFDYCTALETAVIGKGVTEIETMAFSECESLRNVSFQEGLTTIQSEAFAGCGLTSVELPHSVTYIGREAFWNSGKLKTVTVGRGIATEAQVNYAAFTNGFTLIIADGVTEISEKAFYSWKFNTLIIADSVTTIREDAFWNARFCTTVTLPASLKYVETNAFVQCTKLKTVYFRGPVPEIEENSNLLKKETTAYYPENDETWTEEVRRNYGEVVTWIPYTPEESTLVQQRQKPETKAIYGGSSGTAGAGTQARTATFSGLVAGEEYLFLALESVDTEEPLSAENVLYVKQATAPEDGVLKFTYIPRVETKVPYVMVCGASNMNLKDAVITFPEMTATGSLTVISPTVTYNDEVLTEGQDYVLVGTVSYIEAGTYTCGIRGIMDYAGYVECTYTVTGKLPEVSFARMVLGNSLDFQFAVPRDGVETAAYAVIQKGAVTKTVPASAWTQTSINGVPHWIISYDGLAAKEMADQLTLTVCSADGKVLTEAYKDSVCDYVQRAFDGQTDKGKTMLVDMLNYGAAAQQNFKYNTEYLANSKLTDAQKAYGTTTAAATENKQLKGTNYVGTRLVLESRIQMQVAFSGLDRTMYAVYSYTDHYGKRQNIIVTGEEFIESGGMYGIELSELVYADARQLVTINVYNFKGKLLSTVQDSIESYVDRSGATNPLFDALMKFTDSAKAYIHQ